MQTESERIPCTSCGAEVLRLTAKRYEGLCKPCYDKVPSGPQYHFLELHSTEECNATINEWARIGWTVVSHSSYLLSDVPTHTFVMTRMGKWL